MSLKENQIEESLVNLGTPKSVNLQNLGTPYLLVDYYSVQSGDTIPIN
jgi:hypothetical protein